MLVAGAAACAPEPVAYEPVVDTRAMPPGRNYGQDLAECRQFAFPADAAAARGTPYRMSPPVQVSIIRRCLAGRGYRVLY